jgi:hypothetical protein
MKDHHLVLLTSRPGFSSIQSDCECFKWFGVEVAAGPWPCLRRAIVCLGVSTLREAPNETGSMKTTISITDAERDTQSSVT